MSLTALIASLPFFAPLPPLDAPTRADLNQWRADVRRVENELEALENGAPDVAVPRSVASSLARMEAHLHLVRAQICEDCKPGQLAPSIYDDAEQRCGEGAVTSSLSGEEYVRRMRGNTQWMRTRIARMYRENSFLERKRLSFQYYNRIRVFIEQAAPTCRDTSFD